MNFFCLPLLTERRHPYDRCYCMSHAYRALWCLPHFSCKLNVRFFQYIYKNFISVVLLHLHILGPVTVFYFGTFVCKTYPHLLSFVEIVNLFILFISINKFHSNISWILVLIKRKAVSRAGQSPWAHWHWRYYCFCLEVRKANSARRKQGGLSEVVSMYSCVFYYMLTVSVRTFFMLTFFLTDVI